MLYGIGNNDKTCPAKIKGKALRQYVIWQSMLKRVAESRFYQDCYISDNFLNYSYFYNWATNRKDFQNITWQLDKDLLVKGNKEYGETTCLFLPPELNLLLTTRKAKRGDLPIGVCATRGKFQASLKKQGINTFLGYYNDPIEAFYVYKAAKETHIKHMAELYKDKLSDEAYLALLSYIVDLED